MKRIILLSVVLTFLLAVTACQNITDTSGAVQEDNGLIHNPEDIISNAEAALQYLKAGNQRYLEEHTINRSTNAEDRKALMDSQQPFAVIVTCSDSRVSPELFFDQKLGDIFVIRSPGNIGGVATLGAVEYAVKYLQVPLVVVVGHSSCGEVASAIYEGEYPYNMQLVIERIGKAIQDITEIEDAIYANIKCTADEIRRNETIAEEGTMVAEAYYHITSGEITWIQKDE